MVKTLNKISLFSSIILIFSVLLLSCREKIDEYAGLEYRGGNDIHITTFSNIDTLIIDAGPTSLAGQWLIDRGKLLFLDEHVVGIHEYDMRGNFIGKYIERGRGPNEMIGPARISTTDGNGNIIMIDSNMMIHSYDSLYKTRSKPYLYLSDLSLKNNNWTQLLHNPDPEVKYMYERHAKINRVKVVDNIMIMPVITEHVTYNGYETSTGSVKKFWRNTYTFINIDLKNKITGNLFGTYPPAYRRNNIPVFSSYDFDTDAENRNLYVGYMADSLIYKMDITSGRLLCSFGCAAAGISKSYPSTTSFNEYSSVYKKHHERYGYYTQLVLVKNYLFRGYKKEGNTGYGLQVYFNNILVGDIAINEPFDIIGEYDGSIYGVLPVDLDNECFRILKLVL